MKMKRIYVAVICGLLVLNACDKSDDLNAGQSLVTLLNVEDDGTSVLKDSDVTSIMGVTPDLTPGELTFLYTIRENEKLARDLYSSFSQRYPTAISISQIAMAEYSHIICIEAVFNYYEVDYPALTEAGVFESADLQQEYNELLNKSASLQEVYSAMASVEEKTIYNYQLAQKQITNTNIAVILSNMVTASSNHLRAVVRQINYLGGSYTPVYLSSSNYNSIIGSGYQNGNTYCHQNSCNSIAGCTGHGHNGNTNHSGNCTNNSHNSGNNSNGHHGDSGNRGHH